MRLRDATADDIDAIAAIYNASIPGRTATADLEPQAVEKFAAAFEGRDPARRPWIVAEESGEIVGFASVRDFNEKPAYRDTVEVSFYVASAAQGRGIGSKLLEEMIDRARQARLVNLIALIFSHNEPSLKLVERHGFERWGYLPGVCRMDGRWYDVAILGRKIA